MEYMWLSLKQRKHTFLTDVFIAVAVAIIVA